MNHQEKLIEIYKFILNESYKSIKTIAEIQRIPQDILDNIRLIGANCSKQKGVYTVLVTLLTHKYLFPQQDIRFHQKKLPSGFSARTIDTKYITPTLKNLGLPSSSESGWLTRSLEQPFPYTMEYQGKISGKGVKTAFLSILNFIETDLLPINQQKISELLLISLLKIVIELSNKEIIEFDKITELSGQKQKKVELKINDIISYLQEHFYSKYTTKGASKLPVIAIYAIYKLIVQEIARYKNYTLKPLGSHTASDRTSKSAGDIEVYSIEPDNHLLEVIEIKYEKLIDKHMVAIAKEKILRFSPRRYLILSSVNVKKEDENDINQIIDEILNNHQCQLIVNGIFPTLKYYLRLVNSLAEFINQYSSLIETDQEIDFEHKQKWAEIIQKIIVSK